jgi:hypothetical protein
MFAGDGIKLGDLFGRIFPTNAVVGIVGEDDVDDEIFQGFCVALGFDGVEIFLLGVPSMPPGTNGLYAQTDLRDDVNVVLMVGGKQNDLNASNEVLRRITSFGKGAKDCCLLFGQKGNTTVPGHDEDSFQKCYDDEL